MLAARAGDSAGMNVLVLIAGVADPKWPLPAQINLPSVYAHSSSHPQMSPFDEAALELALQVRDAQPGTAIQAWVAGPESLARRVAEWRLDRVCRLPENEHPWDGQARARGLAHLLDCPPKRQTLILMGREWGDWDDGTVPALLARQLGLPHLRTVLGLQVEPAGLQAIRQSATGLEQLRLPWPALLGVSNDSGNRLRKPLLKNVMAARKLVFEELPARPARGSLGQTAVWSTQPSVRSSPCQMLTGGIEQQAQQLARLLREERP